MAVLPFDLDEEERLRQERLAGGGGTQLAGEAGEGTPGGEAGGASPNAGQSPQAAGTSGWTDVNAYLDANQEQAIGTADKIAGRLGEEAGATRGLIDSANTKFRSAVDENAIRPDDEFLNNAATNPAEFAKDEANVSKFQKIRDAQYGGPSQFQDADDYTSILGKIDEANQKSKAIDTEAGREGLLAGVMKNPTKGMTSLDNLLIGANPNARARLAEGAKPFGELQAYLDQTGADAGAYAQKGKEDTDAARMGLQTRFTGEGGVVPTFQQDFETRLGGETTKQSALNMAIDKFKNREALTDEELTMLGVKPEDYKLVQNYTKTGYDFNPYTTVQNEDVIPDRATYGSEEDRARIAALERMLGTDLSESELGGYNPTSFKFDLGGFVRPPEIPGQPTEPTPEVNPGPDGTTPPTLSTPDGYSSDPLQQARTADLNLATAVMVGNNAKPGALEAYAKTLKGPDGPVGANNPYKLMNGVHNMAAGSKGLSSAIIDSYKAMFRLGLLDASKLKNPDIIWSKEYPVPVYQDDMSRWNIKPVETPRPLPPPPPATGSTNGPPNPSGPYNESDSSTWTQEQHPANAQWMPGNGWATSIGYKNPPRR